MGMRVIKYLLFIFNLLFFLIGLALIVAGALVQTKFRMYFVFFGGQVNVAAIMLIAIGVIIFIVAFFGCLGAVMENNCMLMTFSVLLTLVFILEVSAAIAAYLLNNKLKDMISNKMLESMNDYSDHAEVREVWNNTQQMMKCCGSKDYKDWQPYLEKIQVPDSCCIKNDDCGNMYKINPSEGKIYVKGCAQGLIDWAKSHIAIIAGVALGVAFVEIIGIILACCLGFSINKEGKDYTPM